MSFERSEGKRADDYFISLSLSIHYCTWLIPDQAKKANTEGLRNIFTPLWRNRPSIQKTVSQLYG